MKTNCISRIGLSLAFCASMFATSAYAVPISGSFILTDDANPTVTIATGSFTTGSTITAGGYTDFFGVTYDTVDITLLNLTDQSSGTVFGNFSYDASAMPTGNFAPTPVGILANSAIESILGFTGEAANLSGSSLTLLGPNDVNTVPNPPLNPVSSYTLVNLAGTSIKGFSSGVQVVPEPASLALLGIGLVGFGVSRRLKRSA